MVAQSEFFIEVTVSTARKAQDILNDMFRNRYDLLATNFITFDDPRDAEDALATMEDMGVEILETNI